MAAGGAWLQNVINLTSTAFALPLLGVAVLMGAIAFSTGNRQEGKIMVISGLIGFALMTGINVFASSIPRMG